MRGPAPSSPRLDTFLPASFFVLQHDTLVAGFCKFHSCLSVVCVTVLKCVQATAVCHGGVRAASHRTRPGECWLSTWSYQTAARTLITSQTRDTLSVLSHSQLLLSHRSLPTQLIH